MKRCIDHQVGNESRKISVKLLSMICPKRTKRDDNVDILAKEIGSWNNYEHALREENRLLFNKMLRECGENEDYIKAAESKDEFFSSESLFASKRDKVGINVRILNLFICWEVISNLPSNGQE